MEEIQVVGREEKRNVIIAGVRVTSGAGTMSEASFDHLMQELSELCGACGLQCVGEVRQNLERTEQATCMGHGKVEELRELLEECGADCAVFLNALSPAQLANLSDDLDAEVLDKTKLILNIFSERARTAEAKLQVEYANLEYMLPRLVGMRKNLSRQGGAGGSMSNKGSGEKQLELDRRHIEKRMAEVRKGLKQIESGRATKSKRRRSTGIPLVALAGYTNAGKSTLMNRMLMRYAPDEEKTVFEKDMLFATLDTTVRRITAGNNQDFLLSDTVGFIEDLPHDLVKAFRSTLGEIKEADLILQVVDYSDEHHQRHMEVTEAELQALSAAHIPMIYVMNKAELVMEEAELPRVSGNRIFLSAKKQIGLSELTELITRALFGDRIEAEFLIPYGEGSAEHKLRETAEVLCGEYREDGIYLRCRLSQELLGQMKRFQVREKGRTGVDLC